MTKKIALVTGANRGLGWELSEQLLLKGYTVYMGVRDIEKSRNAWLRLSVKEQAHLVELDLKRPETFKGALETIEKNEGYLDLLINNAGVMLDGDMMVDSTTTITEEALRKTFEVNFFGVINLTNCLLPLLAVRPGGHVINISSEMGSLGLHAAQAPLARTFAYNASKAALNAYTIHLANALRTKGIMVNSVHPGWLRTDMGGEMAPLSAQQGADPIISLALQADAPTGRFYHQAQEIEW